MSFVADSDHLCWLQFDSELALPGFVSTVSAFLYSAATARSVGRL